MDEVRTVQQVGRKGAKHRSFREIATDSQSLSHVHPVNWQERQSRRVGPIPESKRVVIRVGRVGRRAPASLELIETVLTETVGWIRVAAPYSGFDSVACERIALAPRGRIGTCRSSIE
jgi:hypothetical protein